MEDKNKKNLSTYISDAIDERGGISSFEEIIAFVGENWIGRSLSDGTAITDQDLEFCIRIALSTNPKFMVSPTCFVHKEVLNLLEGRFRSPGLLCYHWRQEETAGTSCLLCSVSHHYS